MKKLLFFLLLLTGIANAQVVNIPDANFKAALLAPTWAENSMHLPVFNIDTNSDGQIELSEAQDITLLVVDGASISDLTGIESFTNLEQLSCAGNQITSLVLTGMNSLQSVNFPNNTALTYVDLSGLNAITFLDLTGNPNVSYVNVSNTSVDSINITNNAIATVIAVGCPNLFSINLISTNLTLLQFGADIALNNITVWNSQLTSMNIQNLPSLQSLSLQQNPLLGSLIMSNDPMLSNIFLEGSPITLLDVSGVPSIVTLSLGDNLLTTLDVSSLTQLDNLTCINNPNLQTLFIKNGRNENFLSIGGNPSLQFICADDSQVASVQSTLNSLDMSNTVCNSYCSFTPGGNYNTITGIAHFDANNNGCDNADITPNNVRVNITDGSATGASFLNNSGNYSFYTQAGNFTIAPSVENPTFFNFSPVSATIPFANNNSNTTTQNFCITANGSHHDVEMVISPVIPARPGFDAIYKLIYKNKGNQTENVFLNFNYDDSRLNFVTSSTVPFLSSSGAIMFNIDNVHPFENGSVLVTMHVNAPTDSPAVNVGDVLNFTSFIDVTTDENWPDNAFTLNQTVVGSFDPNNITCLEGNVVAPSEIGNYLHYALNFENTGTDVAENIVVKMQVDPAQFNINSLQLLNASHPMEAKITGNIVEFVFKNIDLNIGGHGHILLKLKSNSMLSTGSTVSRRADIFFDYNLPVDTGAANTTFQVLKTQDFQTDSSVVLFPNPTNGLITVKSENAIKSVSIFDVQGRILTTHTAGNSESEINLSNYPKGIYFVKVATDAGTKTDKIIRQ